MEDYGLLDGVEPDARQQISPETRRWLLETENPYALLSLIDDDAEPSDSPEPLSLNQNPDEL